MNSLDLLLAKNLNNLDNIQADCFDTRTVGGEQWCATLTINEEVNEDDDEELNFTNINFFIEEIDGVVSARYTLDYVVAEAGINDRVCLKLNSSSTVEDSMAWFEIHYKDYDLEDFILPVVKKFFTQTNTLLPSL